MVINNFLFLSTLEIMQGFLVWRVVAKLTAKPRNYSQTRPLATIWSINLGSIFASYKGNSYLYFLFKVLLWHKFLNQM